MTSYTRHIASTRSRYDDHDDDAIEKKRIPLVLSLLLHRSHNSYTIRRIDPIMIQFSTYYLFLSRYMYRIVVGYHHDSFMAHYSSTRLCTLNNNELLHWQGFYTGDKFTVQSLIIQPEYVTEVKKGKK